MTRSHETLPLDPRHDPNCDALTCGVCDGSAEHRIVTHGGSFHLWQPKPCTCGLDRLKAALGERAFKSGWDAALRQTLMGCSAETLPAAYAQELQAHLANADQPNGTSGGALAGDGS